MVREHRAPRGALHRYGLPAAILLAGACLWPAGAHVPGAPWIMVSYSGQRSYALAVSPSGRVALLTHDPARSWVFAPWEAPRIAAAPAFAARESRRRWSGMLKRRRRPDGTVSFILWRGDGGTPEGAQGAGAVDIATGRLRQGVETPFGAACAPDGTLYCTDGPYIRRIGPRGAHTTVAGRPSTDYYTKAWTRSTSLDYSPRFWVFSYSGPGQACFLAGDGGPALAADLLAPEDIACDSAGNLYLADMVGNVRKVTRSGIITTVVSWQGRLPLRRHE